MKRVLGILAGVVLAIHAHAQPARAPLDLHGTAPITVTPSGVGNTPRVIACPTCGTGGINQLTGEVSAGPGSGSQPATITPTGVTAGTYARATFVLNSSGYVAQAASNGGPVISPLGGIYLTGRFYIPFSIGSTPNSAMTANTLFACPFVAMSNGTIISLTANLGTFTTAGNIELGIYADNGGNKPGNLLIDAGQYAVSATGLVTTSAISHAITLGNLYWLTFNESVSIGNWSTQGATQQVLSYRGHATSTQPIVSTAPMCVSVAQTFGPMPTSFPPPTTLLASGPQIVMGF